MRRSRLKPTHALLAIVVAIAMLLVWGAKGTVDAFRADEASQTQTTLSSNTVKHIRQIQISLAESETAQRGYVITKDTDYLTFYQDGIQRYRNAIGGLNQILKGNKTRTQIELIFNIEALSEEKIAEMAGAIDLVQKNRNQDAIALINEGSGKRLMFSIRNDLNELYEIERSGMDNSLAVTRNIQKSSFWRLVSMGVGVLLLLSCIIYLFIRAVSLDQTLELLEEVEIERQRSDLLSKELNHRVKNLFAVITSIVRLTGRNEKNIETAVKKISDRILALSHAHSLTVSKDTQDVTDLESLIRALLSPYETATRHYKIEGPHLELTQSTLTPLGLLLHELATNALKYGAWSTVEGGTIDIHWENEPDEENETNVTLYWNESSITALKNMDIEKTGFGFRMMSMSLRQLNGDIERTWNNGLKLTARFQAE